MGPGAFFSHTNPELADILGDSDFDFENCYFLDLLDPKFPDFQVPRFPDSQTEAWAGRRTAPRHLRTTKLVRCKELGQYRENPISASPVLGIIRVRFTVLRAIDSTR